MNWEIGIDIHTLLCIKKITNENSGEGNGNPLQCSCLENPRDRGPWWAAIYGVAQSRTRLKLLSSSSRASLVAQMVESACRAGDPWV